MHLNFVLIHDNQRGDDRVVCRFVRSVLLRSHIMVTQSTTTTFVMSLCITRSELTVRISFINMLLVLLVYIFRNGGNHRITLGRT